MSFQDLPMKKIDHAIVEFKEMDEMANRTSPVHELNPMVKLIATIAYIFFVVSFDKYDLDYLFYVLPFFVYKDV